MAREQELLAAFIEFADTFVDDYDVVDFLHRLATRCVELVDAAEAGIMLADRDGTLHYVASSSERMRLIELFELQHDEGPCLDAYRDERRDPRRRSATPTTRWPRFAPHAREVGFAVGVGAADAAPQRGDRRAQRLLDAAPTAARRRPTGRSRSRSPTSPRSASCRSGRSTTRGS